MTTRAQKTKPARKTIDAVLGPESWVPIVKWVRDHQKLKGLFGMLIDMAAIPGIVAMLTHGDKLAHTQDMKLRLHHHKMDALYQQLRFWESCMDELSKPLQESAPPPGVFQEAALEIEGAQIEATRIENSRNRTTLRFTQPPACNKCGRPVEGEGRATVDLDNQGRTTALYTHLEC